MNKNEKAEIVEEVKGMLDDASAVYLTNFSGITVSDITDIRNEFRKEGVQYKVIKNTLFNRAISETGKYPKLGDHLVGMTGYAFAKDNLVAPAKIIKKFADNKISLELKACYIEDQYFDGSKLADLAALPSKKEIIAGILGSLDSPISGIVGAVNAVMRDLVSVVDEVAKTKAA